MMSDFNAEEGRKKIEFKTYSMSYGKKSEL